MFAAPIVAQASTVLRTSGSHAESMRASIDVGLTKSGCGLGSPRSGDATSLRDSPALATPGRRHRADASTERASELAPGGGFDWLSARDLDLLDALPSRLRADRGLVGPYPAACKETPCLLISRGDNAL